MRKAYQTDLSDAEWFFLEPLLPLPNATPGVPRRTEHPRDPKRRLLHRPRRLRLAPPAPRLPTLEDSLALLPLLALGRDVGEGACRPAQASASSPEEGPTTERGHIADSQSLKTTGVGGKERGYDGGKKIKGILSAICWSTRRDWCSKCCSTAQK